ncbi:MAG TPA: NADH-quinone oxidoreductase subunit L [Candidatus Acidoferrales bacterium]|nr:NADH-quinone oxidoreductase subunit L [Candidatus Acidoferrales bacterium]
MFILEHLWIIPVLPLLGAAVNGLFGKNWSQRAINTVALGTTGLSFAATLELVREFRHLSADQVPWLQSYFTWITAGNFRAGFDLQVDQLTIVMLLVVTGVGWLIHIYSTGYMAHEGGYYRFFACLNLFMFFMLILVLAANYGLLFVGWEGVGLCSYLLIGFYFLKQSAVVAGKKAFIVNRIGDFGFLLGLFLIFWNFGTLDFKPVFEKAAGMPADGFGQIGLLTGIALLLLAGACGKSAQVPLYVWLPDAMEGPTPVSALIHAATMVAAGVYVVARSHVIFVHAPTAMMAVAVMGAVTALFAATIALAQTDIKRVLAYSTISQLGYMFLACGVGAFAAGIFHLMTHAFFKALLFLAAGSVIHALGGIQEMPQMGGLRKKIPWTFWTMLMGALAIAGAPLFSGFFSKDLILYQSFVSPYGSRILWAVGIAAALLTSFYMFRLIFLTFFGQPRYDVHAVHVHESPRNMLAPLVVLAALAVGGGWVAAPVLRGGTDHFKEYLAPVFASSKAILAQAALAHPVENEATLEHSLMYVAIAVALAGFLVAWQLYLRRPEMPARLAETLHRAYTLLRNKYYVDEIYDYAFVRPLNWISTRVLWQTVDERGIDGSVNGLARVARRVGEEVRLVQSGNTRSYAAWVVLGAVAFTSLLLWMTVR